MKQYNCKNCGAPLTSFISHSCEYCGSYIKFDIDKVEEKVNLDNIYNLEYIGYHEDILSDKIICKYSAIEIMPSPIMREAYRNESGNLYIKEFIRRPNEKKVYLAVYIEIELLRLAEYDVKHYLIKKLPKNNDTYRVVEETIEDLKKDKWIW